MFWESYYSYVLISPITGPSACQWGTRPSLWEVQDHQHRHRESAETVLPGIDDGVVGGKTIPSPGWVDLIAACLWPTWKHLFLYDQPTKLCPLFTHACHMISPICPAQIDLLNLYTCSRGTLGVYLLYEKWPIWTTPNDHHILVIWLSTGFNYIQ